MKSLLKVKTSFVYTIIFLAIFLFCFGCPRKEEKTDNSLLDDGKTFRFTNTQPPTSLDVNKALALYESRIINILFEGLARYGDQGKLAELAVAEKYDVKDEGRVHIFYLRKNAHWSDGSPVTAHDFVASYQRILNPATGGQYANMLYHIVNAREIHQGDIKDFSQLGVKALNDYTLEFNLKYPVPYFFELMTHHTYFPIPRQAVEKHGADWTKPENIVCNGPFVLESQDNEKLVMIKNKHYWEKERIKLEKVIAYTHEDQDQQLRMFKNGQVDWLCSQVSKRAYPKIKQDPCWLAAPYLGTFFLSFNVKKKPFDDPRVRMALSLAFDRKIITERIFTAGELPAYNFVPQGTAGYYPIYRIGEDPREDVRKAQELLEEAGYPEGRGFPEFSIMFDERDQNKRVCLVISRMWRRNLKIKVNIEGVKWDDYITRLKSVDYDVARRGWVGDYNDAYSFLELWLSENSNNDTGWSHKKYDKIIRKSNYQLDKKKRRKYFQYAEKILLQQSPVIPIYFYIADQMIKPYVRGLYPRIQNNDHGQKDIAAGKCNITDNHPINYIWIDLEARKKYLKQTQQQ